MSPLTQNVRVLIHLCCRLGMKRFSSLHLDRELRDILAYLRGPEPSRNLTAERLSRLAFLVKAREDMSRTEALLIIGLKPSDTPSEEEIQEAYRKKVFKYRMHPDLGGSHEAMVELNIARDILIGKRTPDVGTSVEDVAEDLESKAVEILDKEMKPLGKKPYRWIPTHNFALNRALFGWNAWHFTILPFMAHAKAYRPAKRGKPEGIVLHPNWASYKDAEWGSLTPEIAERIISTAKKLPSIKEAVQLELKWIETKFGIDIPSGVKSKILNEAEKVAKRRIDVDRLRIKDELWPFDGGKPIKLGTFD